MFAKLLYAISRWIDTKRLDLWARRQDRVWATKAARDQLDQIIWRLEMGATTVDQRAALALARMLRDGLGGRI